MQEPQSAEKVLVLLTLDVKLLLSHMQVFLPLISQNALDSFVNCLFRDGALD